MRVNWLLAVAIAGCSAGSSSSTASQTVGSTGGDVQQGDGSGVKIPSGALPANTQITATATPGAPAPPTAMPVGTPVTFGPEGQQFSQPVTVTVTFDPAKIPAGKTVAQLAIFTAPAGSSAYTQLQTTVVDATHLSAQVSHFSTFVAALPTACAVSCGTSGSACAPNSGGNGTGTSADGGTGCVAMTGCGCTTLCNADGTPPATQACGTPTSGSAGTGGSSGTGGTGNVCPNSGTSYAVTCTNGGACVCSINGVTMATVAAADCSGDAHAAFAQYTACGFPGVYAPPAPTGTTGTGPSTGATADGGSSGGPSGGSGGTSSGTASPDMSF
jgi:hypothetical protein